MTKDQQGLYSFLSIILKLLQANALYIGTAPSNKHWINEVEGYHKKLLPIF